MAETVDADPHTEEEVTPVASEVGQTIQWDPVGWFDGLASWQVAEDGWQQVPTKQARRAGMPRLPRPRPRPTMDDHG